MVQSRFGFPLFVSLAAAIVTLALKWTAYWLTGSVGLLSDATESFANLLAALTAYLSVWYSSRPVDPSHTYGHEKIEYFSSGLEGGLIIVTAVAIAWYAVKRLLVAEPLESLDWGMGIASVAALVNLGAGQFLLRVGRRHDSIVLEAGGRHLMTDVLTTFAVVAGLILVRLTNVSWVDPVVGLAVAAHIVWTGLDLVKRSFNGLMDHALPDEEQAAVRTAIEACLTLGMDFHALRTRQAGSRRFVDFHLLVPGTYSVRRAHEFTARVEEAVCAALPGAEITVHIEPIEEPSAWDDSALVQIEQAAKRDQAEHGKTGSP
jgi:cation diffusion facilitator family transporter